MEFWGNAEGDGHRNHVGQQILSKHNDALKESSGYFISTVMGKQTMRRQTESVCPSEGCGVERTLGIYRML